MLTTDVQYVMWKIYKVLWLTSKWYWGCFHVQFHAEHYHPRRQETFIIHSLCNMRAKKITCDSTHITVSLIWVWSVWSDLWLELLWLSFVQWWYKIIQSIFRLCLILPVGPGFPVLTSVPGCETLLCSHMVLEC